MIDWDVQVNDLDGIQLVSGVNPNSPAVEMHVRIAAGAFHEYPKHKPGVAHFLEHAPFRGTVNCPRNIHEAAAEFAAQTNAYTNSEETIYHITVPKERWRDGVRLLTDIVMNPLLDLQTMEGEGKVIVGEMRYRKFEYPHEGRGAKEMAILLDGHPAAYEVIGTKSSVPAITSHDLRNYRGEYYRRENVQIAVVGPVERDEIKAEIGSGFRALPHGEKTTLPTFTSSGGYRAWPDVDTYEGDVKFTVAFPYRGGQWKYADEIGRALLQNYLTDSAAPAIRDVREQNKLVYGIGSSSHMSNAGGFISFSCDAPVGGAKTRLEKLVNHATTLAEGRADRETYERICEKILNADKREYANTKCPDPSWLLRMIERDGAIGSPEAFLDAVRSYSFEDFVAFVRKIFAKPATIFEYGDPAGMLGEARFREMLAPPLDCRRPRAASRSGGQRQHGGGAHPASRQPSRQSAARAEDSSVNVGPPSPRGSVPQAIYPDGACCRRSPEAKLSVKSNNAKYAASYLPAF